MNLRQLTRLTLLATVLAVAVAVAVAHAYTFTFRYSPVVSTSMRTFTATKSLVLYIPPGAYGKINVTVQATNPGTSSAGILVSAQCANAPSVAFKVPAGGSATGVLTIIIPSPPTSYVACTITANVTNVTGIALTFRYDTDISMTYNTTTVEYTLNLFTEPYFVIGTSYYFFDTYTIYLARSGTTLVNATFSAKFSDSYVSLVSISTGNNITVEIRNTYHYTGRYLGKMTLIAKINEKTANIMFLPLTVKPSSTELPKLVALPTVDDVFVAQGQELELGIATPLKVVKGTTWYTVPISNVEIIEKSIPSGMTAKSGTLDVGSYKLYLLAVGVPKNDTTVSVLALANVSDWFEPIVAQYRIITKPINVTVVYSVGTGVDKFARVVFKPLGLERYVKQYSTNYTALVSLVKPPSDLKSLYLSTSLEPYSGYLIIRAECEGAPLYDYVYHVAYVETVGKSGTVSQYVNVTNAVKVPDSSASVTVVDHVPQVKITLNDYYSEVTRHVALFVPAYEPSTFLRQEISVVAPIRFVYEPIFKTGTVDHAYLFAIVDDKPYSGMVRKLEAPSGVAVTKVSKHCYMIEIPLSLNATPLTFDLTADLAVKVTYNNGQPASGIIVEVWQGSQLVFRGTTNSHGIVVIDPTYGTYTVRVIYGNGNMISRQINVLDDDVELSIELPVPPPSLKISQVLVSGPSTVTAGEPFNIVVTVYTNIAPTHTVTLTGAVTCSGPTTVTRTVYVTVDKGSTVGRGMVRMVLDKAGQYTCWAEVQGVKSINTLQITVTTRPTATILGIPLPYLAFIIIIIAIAVAMLVMAYMYVRRETRRYSIVPEKSPLQKY